MLALWHLWIIAAIVLFIVEMLIPAFVLASLGAGCLVSSLAAALHLGMAAQIATFSAGTLVSFFGIRPFVMKYCYKASPGVRTNVDALVGKHGRVTEDIDDISGSGRVLVGGDDWKAVAPGEGAIGKNAKVEIVGVEGVKLHVKRIPD